jgi:phosphoribosyl-ATP pyrophosphohydrolase
LYDRERQFVNGNTAVSEIINAASSASKEIKDKTQEELNNLKNKFKTDVDAMTAAFEEKVKKEKHNLLKRLELRHSKKVNELLKEGKSAQEAEQIVKEEDNNLVTELVDQLQSQHDAAIAKKNRESNEAEIQAIDKQHVEVVKEAADVIFLKA